jgi:hypothetical protein
MKRPTHGFVLAPLLATASFPPDSSAAHAEAAPENYEHLRTRSAHTVEQAELQLDLVLSYLRDGRLEAYAAAAELEYGLTRRLQLELEVPYRRVESASEATRSEVGDAELGLKYGYGRGGGRAYAVAVDFEAPTGDRSESLGRGRWAAEFAWLASFESCGFGAHFEIGGEIEESEGPEEAFANVALDFGTTMPGLNWQLAANLKSGEGRTAVALAPGARWAYRGEGLEEFSLSVGLPIGLSDDAEDWGILLGIEFEF